MRKPSTFEEILVSYDIKYTAGDIRFTETGIKIGTDRDDAIRMLIESFRLTEPQLQEMFRRIINANGIKDELNIFKEQRVVSTSGDLTNIDGIRQSLDQIKAYEVFRDAEAGALMVILNDLLGNFRSRLGGSDFAWCSAGPLISQRSIGVIIGAGANSFRHYDEWIHDWNKRKKFTNRQLNSIDVIADVLRVERLRAAKNASFELLFALSHGYWDNLARSILHYAQAVADL